MNKNTPTNKKSTLTKLLHRPLEEAWLTIGWKLERVGPGLNFQKDSHFPIALGSFANGVSSKFPHLVAKKESEAPLDLLPYIARYQFRSGGPDKWPLLQLGPGIATINHTYSYNWEDFLNDSLYLREKLVKSYKNVKLEPESISLKYRNAILCNYKKENIFSFLNEKLHYQVQMPEGIPGKNALSSRPLAINYSTIFDIKEPRSQAALKIATGYKTIKDNEGKDHQAEYLINDIEVISKGSDVPDYYVEQKFKKWLIEAHNVAYQWFFSLVDGELLDSFLK